LLAYDWVWAEKLESVNDSYGCCNTKCSNRTYKWAVALVGGFYFISEDNYIPNSKFKISSSNDSINWNSTQFTKWKIIVPKDSVCPDMIRKFRVN
jgi:hypothetical protein